MLFEGQRVICVDDSPYYQTGKPTGLVLNKRYTITKIVRYPYPYASGKTAQMVVLAELPVRIEHGFNGKRFRPATDISELQKLLTSTKIDSPEIV
jgi:hypothetical protein